MMKQITLILDVIADVDAVNAERIAGKLRYAAQCLASDGMLAPDDVAIASWTAQTMIIDHEPVGETYPPPINLDEEVE